MKARATTQSLIELLEVLIQDINAIAKPVVLDNGEADYSNIHDLDQHSRRNFVRAVFAYIEASTYCYKHIALNKLLEKGSTILHNEYSLLTEEKYIVDNKGVVKGSDSFLPALPNLKYALSVCCRAFGSSYEVDYTTQGWKNLYDSQKMRNRIVHPNSVDEIRVKDHEIGDCAKAFVWYSVESGKVMRSCNACAIREMYPLITDEIIEIVTANPELLDELDKIWGIGSDDNT